MSKRFLVGSSLAIVMACGVAMTQAAQARAVIGVSIGIAPPAPRVEHVIVRPGRVWAPGYWRWNGRSHVWVGGTWIGARPGYRYQPAGWVHVGGGWRFNRGYWVR